MNAIPLVFNAPKANINVNSVSPINANSIRTNNKLINVTQGMNIGGAAGMLGGGGFSNEAQLRQEVNTSIVALKREAFSLENLIAQAAQTLQDVNKRLSELEGKQGDYVKKADATVASVGGDGKYISAISETDGKINATASNLATSIESGNIAPVTSGVVDSMRKGMLFDTTLFTLNDNETKTVTLSSNRMYLFVNIHAVNGQELIILNCYNGVLRQTRITHANDGNDTVITNSGQNVTFKATTGCRGHLLFLTQYSAT